MGRAVGHGVSSAEMRRKRVRIIRRNWEEIVGELFAIFERIFGELNLVMDEGVMNGIYREKRDKFPKKIKK